MAYGNAARPTRKYAYGVREKPPGSREPFPGFGHAQDQLLRAHRLQNKLVEIELARRAELEKIVTASHPELPARRAAAEAAAAETERLRNELLAANSAARRPQSDPALVAAIAAQRKKAAAAWKAFSELRRAQFADAKVKALLRENDAEFARRRTNARNEACDAGLYWGTAAQVLPRVKQTGPPPKFRRYTGEGLLAVQIQRKADKTSTREAVLNPDGTPRLHPRTRKPMFRHAGARPFGWEQLRAGDNNLLRLAPTPLGRVWETRPPRDRGPAPENPDAPHPTYADVMFRVASTPDGEPVWATLPANISRPFPPGAEIKWAYLKCEKIGTRRKWTLLFDLARDAWPRGEGRALARTGTCAVALGWRRMPDGGLRVACWRGDDGAEGEITLPAERVARWDYCDALRSIRDRLFDSNLAALVAFVAARPFPLPPEFAERTATCGQWRSPARLAALMHWWRANRFPGDGEIFRTLEGEIEIRDGRPHYTGGRRQDRHLYDWTENQRTNNRDWRKQFYREAALGLARRYATVVVEDIDWAELGENAPPEEADEDVNKKYRGIAAVAKLRNDLAGLMEPRRVDPAGVVVTCHACGARCPDPGAGRWVVCPTCGRQDRLVNAARNLLARGTQPEGAVRVPETPPPADDAPPRPAKKKTKSGAGR